MRRILPEPSAACCQGVFESDSGGAKRHCRRMKMPGGDRTNRQQRRRGYADLPGAGPLRLPGKSAPENCDGSGLLDDDRTDGPYSMPDSEHCPLVIHVGPKFSSRSWVSQDGSVKMDQSRVGSQDWPGCRGLEGTPPFQELREMFPSRESRFHQDEHSS